MDGVVEGGMGAEGLIKSLKDAIAEDALVFTLLSEVEDDLSIFREPRERNAVVGLDVLIVDSKYLFNCHVETCTDLTLNFDAGHHAL